MKIPDETLYRNGNKRLQDFSFMRNCLRCIHCPINTQSQILSDGIWCCWYFKHWFDANDLLRYKCKGYRGKTCGSCGNKRFCDYEGKGNKSSLACTGYRLARTSPRDFISGKTTILKNDSEIAYKMEVAYLERKRSQEENGIISELARIAGIKKRDYS